MTTSEAKKLASGDLLKAYPELKEGAFLSKQAAGAYLKMRFDFYMKKEENVGKV